MRQRGTLKEHLIEAKDISELMVDLAYAAVFFGDDDIAAEVMRLREVMNSEINAVRAIAVLAARSPEDAEGMVGVLSMLSAIDKIGDAAEDIARVVLKQLGVPHELRDDLRHAEEVVCRVRLRDENALEGRTLAEAELPTETGMWVIAIRREVSWIFGPEGDTVLHPGDVIFAQGPEEGVDLLRRLAGAHARNLEEPAPRTMRGIDRAVDILVELKNSSEVCVGLAYSAVLFHDKGLAAEVGALEDVTDEMHHELERWALRAVQEGADPDTLRGLLHIAYASEWIADAAQEMTWIVEQDEVPHPIIEEVLAETDEIVIQEAVRPGSGADGRSLRELSLRTETGMEVLAVQRNGRWVYRPRGEMRLAAGDRVVATGPEDGAEDLETLFGAERIEE